MLCAHQETRNGKRKERQRRGCEQNSTLYNDAPLHFKLSAVHREQVLIRVIQDAFIFHNVFSKGVRVVWDEKAVKGS